MALSVRCYTSSRSAPPQALRCTPGAARARGARAVPQLRAAAVSLSSFSLPLSAACAALRSAPRRAPAASRGLGLSLVARAAATGAGSDDDGGGGEYVPWHTRLQQLRAYIAAHGTADVPCNYPDLGPWVTKQRTLRSAGKLSDARIAALDELNFNWRIADVQWETHFQELLAYAEAHNDSTEVPQDCTLGQWVKRQRVLHARGELPAERQAPLDSIGFVWNVYDEQWQKRYDALVAFKLANGGSVLVPTRVGGVANPLGRWLSEQRKRWRAGSLAAEHVAKLEALGVRP
jgi:hypothetical protein